jgi:hypothetical protein
MNCANNHNSVTFNDLIRRCVRGDMRDGRNMTGAIANVADFMGMHPRTVWLRYQDELTGEPRRAAGLADGLWRFLEAIHARERRWLERLERDIEQERNRLQLTLPLEPMNGARPRGGMGIGANGVARAEGDLAAAKKALADFSRARAMRK